MLVDGASVSEIALADTDANVVVYYVHPLKILNGLVVTKGLEAKDVQVIEPDNTHKWLSKVMGSTFSFAGDSYKIHNFSMNGSENVSVTMVNVSGGLPSEDNFVGTFHELMNKYRLVV